MFFRNSPSIFTHSSIIILLFFLFIHQITWGDNSEAFKNYSAEDKFEKGDIQGFFGLGVGEQGAENTNRIGDILYLEGDDFYTGTLSELVYDSKVSTLNLTTGLKFYQKIGVMLQYRQGLDADKERDTLKDSDFLSTNRTERTIFSTSELDTEFREYDVSLQYLLWPHSLENGKNTPFQLHATFGLWGQDWEYTAFNTVQTSIVFPEENATVLGESILYDLSLKGYYLGIMTRFESSIGLVLDAQLQFFPDIQAEDVDEHILRNYEAAADMSGDAIRGNVWLRWNILNNLDGGGLWLGAGAEFIQLDASGKIVGMSNGFPFRDQPSSIDSNQYHYSVILSWQS